MTAGTAVLATVVWNEDEMPHAGTSCFNITFYVSQHALCAYVCASDAKRRL